MPVARPDILRRRARLCPHCGYQFDSIIANDGSERRPRPGDASLCLNCAEALVFWVDPTFTLTVRAMEPHEAAAFQNEDQWSNVRAAQVRLRAMHRKGFRLKSQKPRRVQ